VIRYQGNAKIRQGAALMEGDCIIESAGDPIPGPDPAWSGRLTGPVPAVDLAEGAAWLRLEDGRESEIKIVRAVVGSGLVEFSGAAGLLELR
jgi:hypothetical protein